MRVVAFDGTAVIGGAGVRTAILECCDGSMLTAGERPPPSPEAVKRMIADGYVTPIMPPIETHEREGVVMYRHRDFVFPDLVLEDGLEWSACDGGAEAAYLGPEVAIRVCERYAHAASLSARVAFVRRELEDVHRFVRRGLMVVPGLRSSALAATLYGIMLAAETLQGNVALVRQEIDLMLDEQRVKQAVLFAARVVRTPRTTPDVRRLDRRLVVGSREAPREAA